MRKSVLFAGLLVVGLSMAFILRSDLLRSGAGTPIPASDPREAGQGRNQQWDPSPEQIQVHRVPPTDSNPQISNATLEEVIDQNRQLREELLLRNQLGPLPPGDWDWEVIHPRHPNQDRPDSPLMRDRPLEGNPGYRHRR